MLIAYVSLILALLFIPDNGQAATVVRVALFCCFLMIYKSHAPEDQGVRQLIHSRRVKRFIVVRY